MNPTEILIMISGLITAITIIVIGVRKALVLVRKFIHFLDDYFGEEERPGFPGRPGMQERLRIMEMELMSISFEMKPNHGTSMKDAINRIESRLNELEQKEK